MTVRDPNRVAPSRRRSARSLPKWRLRAGGRRATWAGTDISSTPSGPVGSPLAVAWVLTWFAVRLQDSADRPDYPGSDARRNRGPLRHRPRGRSGRAESVRVRAGSARLRGHGQDG